MIIISLRGSLTGLNSFLMAFNWQTFKTRTLTAAVFVIVMLAGMLVNTWTFFLLFSVIHFGCWWEYQKLIGLIDIKYQKINFLHKYGVMVIGWLCMLFFFINNNFYVDSSYIAGAIGGAVLLLMLPLILAITKYPVNILYSLLGLIYISLPLVLIMSMSIYEVSTSHGPPPHSAIFFLLIPFAILLIACMWINDTMAYIVGSLIGKTPLTKISPKKTWEGTIGGIVLCTATVGLLFQYAINLPGEARLKSYHYYVLPAIASIAGTFGDILESKLKRMAGVKDSGHLMPGHGGFLDRFDSLLVATPFVWLYVYLFMQ
jgi:phosphatidate cytidylyltransferase